MGQVAPIYTTISSLDRNYLVLYQKNKSLKRQNITYHYYRAVKDWLPLRQNLIHMCDYVKT